MPYVVCIVLLDGTLTTDSFSYERITDSRVRNLLKITTLNNDNELSKGYPEGIPNRITVTTKDGLEFIEEVSFPKGHYHNPMTDSELESKFRANVSTFFSEQQATKVIDTILHLEEQRDLEQLMREIQL